ncbi:RsmB/NOP family class I SAM-dependent RNA methyltransferase [Sphingobium phenoxybenzoativorans]|uniref:RsmB/NOP family class I SAM-dependent RNA methyltransferase n=1 Tax=Sphingobium phenoxybenzoativorans TaxID=1592790 RepID=UPI000872AD19|nr:RsmB/NOP family class I SAM-dependent RNA methyltransferase [Sphingobium phenoxybenzoativorans]
MTPAARVQAAIDILDEIIAAARDGGPAADTLIARYFKARRYAGSKDRRAVRDLLYDAVRRTADRPADGRAAMAGLARERPELARLFDGSSHGPAPLKPDDPASEASIVPAWIKPLLANLLTEAEQQALLERAPLDLRVNTLKSGAGDCLGEFPEGTPLDHLPDALRLPEGFPVELTDAWKSGQVEVQDAGSQIISMACEAQPGMTVIDLCAGAGGKTLALAAAMEGRGRLVACDAIRSRLSRLPERAGRAGAHFIETLLLDQGKEIEKLAPLAGLADIVLVDAPCSGTGTWRRNPEARWRLTPQRLERLVSEQARILDFAAPLVAPGGRLVYAVCALTTQEGSGQIDAFIARHPGWTPVLQHIPPGRSCGHGVLLTPAHDGTDGFFFVVLKKA